MTLAEAQSLVLRGEPFAWVAQRVPDSVYDAFAEWFVHDPRVPVARVKPVQPSANGHANGATARDLGLTLGNPCTGCGHDWYRREGPCLVCVKCGTSQGGCGG